MTECERLVAAGVFDADYFMPEERCGFFVSAARKKLWAIEIDLVLQLDKVCRKHGLKYALMFGSLLGAIRHGGFVPWDDDMDVVMSREDYEKLLKCGSEFTYPYFLQTPYTDRRHGYCHAQLRNSNTTAAASQFCYQGMNLGVFLDILTIDNMSKEGDDCLYAKILKLVLDNSTFMRLTNPSLSKKDRARVAKYPGGDPLDRYEEIQRLCQTYNSINTGKVFVSTCLTYGLDRNMFDSNDFSDVKYVSYEGFKLPIPVGYDNILRVIYGDYMEMPPMEKRGGWHDTLHFDADISYVDYVKTIVSGGNS